tara:strand:- start:34 stop:1113 length:1080 start_codon:yes stop_codon:yes gene_type:complete
MPKYVTNYTMKTFFGAFFRVLGAFFALIFLIVIFATASSYFSENDKLAFSYLKGDQNSSDSIGLININGPIISEPGNLYNFDLFSSLEVIYPSLIDGYLKELKTKNVKGVVVSINSPGGSVSATHAIYAKFVNFKKQTNLPIYFHSSEILASGGYWISLSGDKIFANYGSLIGSIGVKGPDWIYFNSPTSLSTGPFGNYVESPEGIELYSNTAGKSKDIFNPFRKPNSEEIFKLQQMVDDIYEDFINLVSSKRKIEKNIIKSEIGAMIYNSNKAKDNFLIDNENNINQTINFLSKKLDLDSFNIITNKKNKFNIFNLNTLLNKINNKSLNFNQKIIKDKFCNNIINGFSSALISSYNKC